MKKYLSILISLFILLIGCENGEKTESPSRDSSNGMVEESIEIEIPTETDSEESVEMEGDELHTDLIVLAENLDIPWSIERREGVFFISEREGSIVKIENGEVERQEILLEEELSGEAEAGLLGFVLHPQFGKNLQAYAYYTYDREDVPLNRIVQLQLSNNQWSETKVLIDNIPSGSVHHGGRLAIGPDELLYATVGDAATPELAQDLGSLGGKIIRINLDGTTPVENPFEDSYVYSYGHRNVQGLAWTEDGKMYASEHGNQSNDELNVIEAGQNYGWPIIEGMEEATDMHTPLFTSGNNETWAPSGMDESNGSLYVAALRGNAVLAFGIETGNTRTLLTDYGRIRDIYIEDEFLYFITNNTDGRGNPKENDDRLIRIGLSELE